MELCRIRSPIRVQIKFKFMFLLDINIELWQMLLGLVGTGAITGGLTYFLTLKNTIKKDDEKLKQEKESTENLEISNDQSRIDMIQKSANTQIENAQKLIEMYKVSVDDIKTVYAEHEKVLTLRFEDLKVEVDQLKKENDEVKRQNQELILQAKERDEKIDELKLQIENIKRTSDKDCSYCAFSDGCKKRLALENQKKSTTKKPK